MRNIGLSWFGNDLRVHDNLPLDSVDAADWPLVAG